MIYVALTAFFLGFMLAWSAGIFLATDAVKGSARKK